MKLARQKIGWTVAGLAGLFTLLQVLPPLGVVPERNPFRPDTGAPPLVIAHGGGLGLFPANTLQAFRGSAALGCDMLETDLRLTRDGVLVTHHDATVARTSNGQGAVNSLDLAELKALDFGHRTGKAHGDPPETGGAGTNPPKGTPEANAAPPAARAQIATVEDLFRDYPTMPMTLELKDRGDAGQQAAHALAELIQRHRMEPRIVVASFDQATLEAFRAASNGRVATSTSQAQTTLFVILAWLRLDWFAPSGPVALQVPVQSGGFHLDRPYLIRAAHRRNLAVHYWTINDPAEMARLWRLGADGLITDRPDLLQQVLASPASEATPAIPPTSSRGTRPRLPGGSGRLSLHRQRRSEPPRIPRLDAGRGCLSGAVPCVVDLPLLESFRAEYEKRHAPPVRSAADIAARRTTGG